MNVDIAIRNREFVNFAFGCEGWLTANVRSVHFAMDAELSYRARFVLRQESAEDREYIQEALDDFFATRLPPYDKPFSIKHEVIINAGELLPVAYESGYISLYIQK